MRTLQEALHWGTAELSRWGLPDARTDVEFLLTSLMHMGRTDIYLKGNERLPQRVKKRFVSFIRRRGLFEPVAYIQKTKTFLNWDFYVDEHVLIPRPETELLVEKARKLLNEKRILFPSILEVGTGSGCVVVSLALMLKNASILAIDISPEALKVARRNANKMMVKRRVRFLRSDLFAGLGPEYKGYFDMIISNPPYVSDDDMKNLERDLFYEPNLALNGRKKGLYFLNSIIQNAGTFLKEKGFLVLELGMNQDKIVEKKLTEEGYKNIEIEKDFSGINRIITGERIGSV